jgi:hypothetical protein
MREGMDQPGQLGQLSCDTEISYWPTSTWCFSCIGIPLKYQDTFSKYMYLDTFSWNRDTSKYQNTPNKHCDAFNKYRDTHNKHHQDT